MKQIITGNKVTFQISVKQKLQLRDHSCDWNVFAEIVSEKSSFDFRHQKERMAAALESVLQKAKDELLDIQNPNFETIYETCNIIQKIFQAEQNLYLSIW